MSIRTARAKRVCGNGRRPETDGNDRNARQRRNEVLHLLFLLSPYPLSRGPNVGGFGFVKFPRWLTNTSIVNIGTMKAGFCLRVTKAAFNVSFCNRYAVSD
jgi:hypothetical protein